VLNSALKLRELVEAMTNLNLIQVGSTRMEFGSISIQQVILSAVKEIQIAVEAKNQKLSLNLPEKALIVRADPEKLKLVFVNLLNNAVRFNQPEGEIWVRAKPMHNEAWVEVQDNGVGIPSSEIENIFKEFYQVEDHMTRRVGGLGLGLSIARGIVKLHNGRVWAESRGEGQGSTFTVVLPSPGATGSLYP
jgi:signal transduction histidine kinase